MSETKMCKLKMAILQMGLEWDTFMKTHIYAGGNKEARLKYYLHHFSHIPTGFKAHCMCYTPIKEQCYILNIETNEIRIIGNECIHLFDIDTKRYCKCGKALNTSKYQVCAQCRKQQSKPIKIPVATPIIPIIQPKYQEQKRCKCGTIMEQSYYKQCNTCFKSQYIKKCICGKALEKSYYKMCNKCYN